MIPETYRFVPKLLSKFSIRTAHLAELKGPAAAVFVLNFDIANAASAELRILGSYDFHVFFAVLKPAFKLKIERLV